MRPAAAGSQTSMSKDQPVSSIAASGGPAATPCASTGTLRARVAKPATCIAATPREPTRRDITPYHRSVPVRAIHQMRESLRLIRATRSAARTLVVRRVRHPRRAPAECLRHAHGRPSHERQRPAGHAAGERGDRAGPTGCGSSTFRSSSSRSRCSSCVEGLLLVIAIRFRRSKHDDSLPPQTHGNNRLEILWTVIPALVVMGMFLASTAVLSKVEAVSPEPAVTVDVTGFQWQWTFDYKAQGLSLHRRRRRRPGDGASR